MTNANLELMLSEVAFLDAFGATVTTQRSKQRAKDRGKREQKSSGSQLSNNVDSQAPLILLSRNVGLMHNAVGAIAVERDAWATQRKDLGPASRVHLYSTKRKKPEAPFWEAHDVITALPAKDATSIAGGHLQTTIHVTFGSVTATFAKRTWHQLLLARSFSRRDAGER